MKRRPRPISLSNIIRGHGLKFWRRVRAFFLYTVLRRPRPVRVSPKELLGFMDGMSAIAGIAYAIQHGEETAKILKAAGDGFAETIRAATLEEKK